MSRNMTVRRDLIRSTGELQAPQLDYILLDGSGSMATKWHATLAGLDQFINVLKSQNVASQGILSVFEGFNAGSIQRDCVIADWPSFLEVEPATSWGGTPLYDAINLMVREVAQLQPANNAASLVIVTDGEETSSRHTDVTQARALLDWCRAQGWQVTFLGCDFNNDRQAAALGADKHNTIGVQKTKLLEAGKMLGEKRLRNIRTGEEINFSDEERTTFGGYLTDRSGDGH